MTPEFSALDIKRHFSSKTLERANAILAANRVLELDWDEDVESLTGIVSGTASEPYVVTADVYGRSFDCYCDCPVGIDCKHAAASLLLFLERSTKPVEKAVPRAAKGSVDNWVERLNDYKTRKELSGKTHSAGHDSCLVYKLSLLSSKADVVPGIEVRVFVARLRNDGSLGSERQYHVSDFTQYHGASTTIEDDVVLDLIRSMRKHANEASYDSDITQSHELKGHLGAAILQQLISTKRVYLGDSRDAELSQGQPRKLTAHWERLKGTDKCHLLLDVEGSDSCLLLHTDPPWYIDEEGHCAGLLQTDIDPELLPILSGAPAIPLKSAQALANKLHIELPDTVMPLPAEPSVIILDDALVPEIHLYSLDDSPDIDNWLVSCLMGYGGYSVAVELQPTQSISRVDSNDDSEIFIRRQHEDEYQYYLTFQRMLSEFVPCHTRNPAIFKVSDHQPIMRDPLGRLKAFEKLLSMQAELEEAGFSVVIQPPVDVVVTKIGGFAGSLIDGGNGWFELGLKFEHDGVQYELLPLVVDWLERTNGDEPLRFQAEDGSWLEVPEELLRPVLDILNELFDDERLEGDALLLPRARALSLAHLRDELEASGFDAEWEDNSRLFELADTLRRFGADAEESMSSASQSVNFQGELRGYQRLGMGWLDFLAHVGLNGILADDMGLGKTAQTLAHIQSQVDLTARKHKKNRNGPFLVVAPTSLLGNWAREVQQFTPQLTVRIWHGGERHLEPLAEYPADIVVTSYALALRDQELLCEHGFKMLILDEAQTIKNPNAKITQALKDMPIEKRLCLTGTPLENHLGELWSLFDFLSPGMLGSQRRFSRHFRTPIEVHGNEARQSRLNAVVQPFMLRRRKEEVAKELPEKTEIIQTITLGDGQAKLYEGIRLAMQARVKKLLKNKGLARSHIEMLDALLKMRQTCCHPQLVKIPTARKVKDSAKTTYLMQMLEELVAEGRKILLFSQFTEMLGLLEIELKKAAIDYVKLTGRTRKRDAVIDAFQQGDVPLFLISLKAGGTGLNLTAADTVIHYDPWWNPAVERQATDRAHRIGQDKPVFVYKLVAKDTVEEKIIAMQQRKQALSDATVEKKNGEAFSSFSADDMLALFDAV